MDNNEMHENGVGSEICRSCLRRGFGSERCIIRFETTQPDSLSMYSFGIIPFLEPSPRSAAVIGAHKNSQ